eukprot:CAMPEP_0201282134 /NCGR_PEP_ID=MMETSP1317-20130820/4900_1 /ASSEMBLY_ACC=CAM_ASM_000770 /TAXON_ID=187299 /ORGANISM="Undescribed Undescribed, Strain Undescribed" /LENGTH=85 /DNA_ID=CAMNT_0047593991 /DNA_START=394 /DNA_END=651 /DNA_ORIENTATION=-
MALIADFVGSKGKEGGRAYSTIGIFDKVFSGLIMMLITDSVYFREENKMFLRLIMVALPICISLSGFLSCLLISGRLEERPQAFK